MLFECAFFFKGILGVLAENKKGHVVLGPLIHVHVHYPFTYPLTYLNSGDFGHNQPICLKNLRTTSDIDLRIGTPSLFIV